MTAELPSSTAQPAATLSADVGGTWVRLRTSEDTGPVVRLPSPSLLNLPGRSVDELRRDMVELLCRAAPPAASAAISFGAAIDHLTGTVYGSAPLWGASAEPYDLAAELRRRRPDVTWILVNDVTAALVDFVSAYARVGVRRVGYLTVSSGIAMRTADLTRMQIPVDEWGLQGEVGHLPLMTRTAELVGLTCECGERDHLASVASGPGIVRAAERLGITAAITGEGEDTEGTAALLRWLPGALDDRDPQAQRLLRCCVQPIAHLIRALWCVDPHLDLLGLGGGVVTGLGDHYTSELRRQLAAATSYADRGHSEGWLNDRLVCCGPDEVDGLRGAELIGRWDLGIAS